jgi:hypothetical protein
MRPNIEIAHFSKANVAETKIMEDILGKPIDSSASGAVANSPPKRTIPLIRERILGSASRYPQVKNALVSKPPLNRISSIESELAKVKSAWARYRSTNSRDAVYGYLESVFALVTRWQRLNYAVKNSRAALSFSTMHRR